MTEMHVVSTAGHVDHGKSTMLRALTGMEPDRWDEERKRGLTIDLGFVWTDLGEPPTSTTVAFVDVPGHRRFLGNMLAGAGASPAALLVVAADDGWSAQSQEHLDVLDLLGVDVLLAVVTKVDLVDDAHAAMVIEDVRARLGRIDRDDVPVVAAAPTDGRGVPTVAAKLHEQLRRRPVPPAGHWTRLWVDRTFTVAGAGTVVTGTLQQGRLAVGDPVELTTGAAARVRGLQCLGERVQEVGPDTRVAVNLAGVSHNDIGRGVAVVTPGNGRPTDQVDARVRALPGQVVGRRGAWQLHVGTAVVEADVHPVLAEPVVDEGVVHLTLRHGLPLRCGDRFVLREVGQRRVVAGGEVLVPWATSRVRGTDARLRRALELEEVAATRGRARVAALVRADGPRPVDELLCAVDVEPGTEVPGVTRLGDHLVALDAVERWAAATVDALDDAGPKGLAPEHALASLTDAGCPHGIAEPLTRALLARRTIHRSGPALLHPRHVTVHGLRVARRREALLAMLDANPWAPPVLADAMRETGTRPVDLQALADAGRVVLAGPFGFTSGALREAAERLVELERLGGPFTASAAKQALGTSRRFAIPLLELMDERGITFISDQGQRTRRIRPSW